MMNLNVLQSIFIEDDACEKTTNVMCRDTSGEETYTINIQSNRRSDFTL